MVETGRTRLYNRIFSFINPILFIAIHQEINDLLGGGDTSVDISLGGLGTHLFRGAEITTRHIFRPIPHG